MPSGPVEVHALWFGFDGATPVGGTSTVRVHVEPNDLGDLRVGFFESEVGGTGEQWQTAGWMAVITSALMLGIDPSAFEFSFDVAGRIDGPSAGGLMTVAVLANFLGDQIDPSVTMTGTINPDGTIGPVGGIPHKIAGAAEAGKTTVLVPSGQRFDYDYGLEQSVDLVQVGLDNGVEVILVPDVHTAYQLLTGSSLPLLTGGSAPQMPPDAFNKYRAGTTNWFARYQQERAKFTELPVEVQELEADLILLADDTALGADQLLGEGQVSRAYSQAFEAAALARLATLYAQLDNLYINNPDFGPMVSRLDAESAVETRLGAMVQRIDAETPRTASDAMAIMEAASNLSVAQGLIFQAQDALANLEQTEYTEDDILTAIYTAAYNYALADLFIDLAEDGLQIGLGFGSAPAPSAETMDAIAETLRRGAEANLAYFDSLIIEPWATDNGVSTEVAQYYFMQEDNSYLTALAAVFGAEQLTSQMAKPESQSLMSMGASLTAYAESSVVIAEYYSLGAQVDENGVVVGYNRETALADMLELADQQARGWLSSVQDEEPVSSIFYYENARIQRQGTPDDQINALFYYWQSAILSEVLATFTATE